MSKVIPELKSGEQKPRRPSVRKTTASEVRLVMTLAEGSAGEQEGALGGLGTLFLDAGAGYMAIVTL